MFRILAGFLALVLTFLAISLLVGPFIPNVNSDPLSLWQHFMYAIAGLAASAAGITLWIWTFRGPST